MAIQYSEEIIIPMLTGCFKPKSEIVDKKRFSEPLKRTMGYFKKDSTQKPTSQSTTKRIESLKAAHSLIPQNHRHQINKIALK